VSTCLLQRPMILLTILISPFWIWFSFFCIWIQSYIKLLKKKLPFMPNLIWVNIMTSIFKVYNPIHFNYINYLKCYDWFQLLWYNYYMKIEKIFRAWRTTAISASTRRPARDQASAGVPNKEWELPRLTEWAILFLGPAVVSWHNNKPHQKD
jgi:hypothetical protein